MSESENLQAKNPDHTIKAEPVNRKDRIISLDVLRGVALLGILVMNILAFALPYRAYNNPTIAGGDKGADLIYWLISFILVEGKMRALFSLLFGASVILLTSKEEKYGSGSMADIYYRRILWLLLFGVVHAYIFLFPGEILYAYAVCGLFLYPFRKLEGKWLIRIGMFVLAILAFKNIFETNEIHSLSKRSVTIDSLETAGIKLTEDQINDKETWNEIVNYIKPDSAAIEKEIHNKRSGYFTILTELTPLVTKMQSRKFYLYLIWDTIGMMLIGMGMIKLGILSGRRKKIYYILIAVLGYGLGILINYFEGINLIDAGFSIEQYYVSYYTYDLRRLLIVIGHIGLILFIYKSGVLRILLDSLASIGQTALSNYILQTIICLFLFYGFGLGLFGKLSRFELFYFTLAIWTFQLVASSIWLRYFQMGPLEWLWRSLTYVKKQPMRK
ncbi:DUF418 domain-containing protein [Bacteroidota bacterium]